MLNTCIMICVQLFVFCIAWGSSKTKASGGRTQTPGRSVWCHCARLLTNEEAWGGDARHQWWVSCVCIVYIYIYIYIYIYMRAHTHTHTHTHIYIYIYTHSCFTSHRGKITIWFLEYNSVSWSCALHSNLRQINIRQYCCQLMRKQSCHPVYWLVIFIVVCLTGKLS